MPAISDRQRKAACAEYGRRKRGQSGGKGRAFGTAKTGDVREFCVAKAKGGKRRKR